MFSNFPFFFVTIWTLFTMQGKNMHLWWQFTAILKNYSFRISPRTFKNVDHFESYLKFKKTLKFWLFFPIPSSKFNEMASFWTHFINNFDGIQFIKRINFIAHRIKIKIF